MSDNLSASEVSLLRDAMRAVGTPAFFDTYQALFRARVAFSTFLMMRFDPGQPPSLLDNWIEPGRLRPTALNEYLDSTYAFDPFFQYRDRAEGGGVFRLSEVAPDRFFSSEYYLQYYRGSGLCDEVGLLAPLAQGEVAHLSMSRRDAQGPFRRAELRYLRKYALILIELLTQHCSLLAPPQKDGTVTTRPPLTDLIRNHAKDVLHLALTAREAQIAGLVLQGHSNGSAAKTLEIATETCKVHRRNLYRKLNISSQRDLFGLFKHLL